MAFSGEMGRAYNEGFEAGKALGYDEGKKEAREFALDWLLKQYLDPKVARESARGKAILKLAGELRAELKS